MPRSERATEAMTRKADEESSMERGLSATEHTEGEIGSSTKASKTYNAENGLALNRRFAAK